MGFENVKSCFTFLKDGSFQRNPCNLTAIFQLSLLIFSLSSDSLIIFFLPLKQLQNPIDKDGVEHFLLPTSRLKSNVIRAAASFVSFLVLALEKFQDVASCIILRQHICSFLPFSFVSISCLYHHSLVKLKWTYLNTMVQRTIEKHEQLFLQSGSWHKWMQ